MSARYTSAALSRALRDAGVSQTSVTGWYRRDNQPGLFILVSGPIRDDEHFVARALDVSDLLDELEERKIGVLASNWRFNPAFGDTVRKWDVRGQLPTMDENRHHMYLDASHESLPEALGLLLLLAVTGEEKP